MTRTRHTLTRLDRSHPEDGMSMTPSGGSCRDLDPVVRDLVVRGRHPAAGVGTAAGRLRWVGRESEGLRRWPGIDGRGPPSTQRRRCSPDPDREPAQAPAIRKPAPDHGSPDRRVDHQPYWSMVQRCVDRHPAPRLLEALWILCHCRVNPHCRGGRREVKPG